MGLWAVCRVALAAAGSGVVLYALHEPLAPTGSKDSSANVVPPSTLSNGGIQDTVASYRLLPSRAEQLHRLRTTLEFDILVLGGGAIACGVAIDAASRGLSVALVELEDFGSGASTRGSKLLPATARGYNEPLVPFHLKNFKGNSQAIEERKVLFLAAPHLCYRVPVVIPLYDKRTALSTWFYFKTHWHIFRDPPLNESRWISSIKTQEMFPLLYKDKLCGSVMFHEATIDDIRLNVALALTAARRGAVVANHVGAHRFLKDKNGHIKGAVVRDSLTGETWSVRAKSVINATGNAVDLVRQMDTPGAKHISSFVLSTCMVLPWHFGHKTTGILTSHDKECLTAMPYQGETLVAGAHKRIDHGQCSLPSHDVITKLLHDWNEQLEGSFVSVRLGEVLSAWTSVASVQESASGKEKQIIEVSQSGLVSMTGGSWIWYRLLAERVLDAAIANCEDLEPSSPCSTKTIKLEGAAHWNPTLYIHLQQKYRLEVDVAEHLANHYGDQAALLARMAANSSKGARSLNPGERLLPRLPYIEAEVRHAVRHEYACTAVDVLARRLGVTFVDAHAAECMIRRVVDLMAVELGWGMHERERQVHQASRFLEEQMGLSVCRPHRHAHVLELDSNEFGRLVRLFEYLDRRQTGWVSLRKLRPHILSETFNPESYITTAMRRLVQIILAAEPEEYIHNEHYVPPPYRPSVESGSTKGTEAFTEKVEALSKACTLNKDTLSEILDEMETATSGGMELGDFLLFMNNLKICQQGQETRTHYRDSNMDELEDLRYPDIAHPTPPEHGNVSQ